MYLPKDVGMSFHLRNQSGQSYENNENNENLNKNKMFMEQSMNLLQNNTKILKGIQNDNNYHQDNKCSEAQLH